MDEFKKAKAEFVAAVESQRAFCKRRRLPMTLDPATIAELKELEEMCWAFLAAEPQPEIKEEDIPW